MRQVSRIIVRNSASGLAAQMAIKVLSFAFSVLIVRRLGQDAFGQYTAVLAYVAIFAFIADLGLSPYSVREVARWRDLPDGTERASALYSNVVALRLMLSALAIVLVVSMVWISGQPLVMVGAVALSALGLALYSIQGTSDAVLGGFERLDLVSGAKVISQVTFVCVGALVLLLGFGYYGLIAANLLGVAVMTYVCWQAIRKLGIRLTRAFASQWPRLLRASFPFGVIGFTLGLSYKFDTVLLSQFRSDAETGYYNAAYSLVFSAVMLSNAINTALYPSLTRQSSSDPASLGRIYERALRYLLIVSLPVAVGGSVLAGQIVPFLYGNAFEPAIPALRIIVWVAPLMFASEFLGYVVLIRDNERHAARAVLISTSVNVAFNLILVPRYGLIAAAGMTVLTEAVLVSQYIWLLRHALRPMRWGPTLVRPAMAAIGMGLALMLIGPHVHVIVAIVCGAAIYGALLLLLGALGSDELRFMRSLRATSESAR